MEGATHVIHMRCPCSPTTEGIGGPNPNMIPIALSLSSWPSSSQSCLPFQVLMSPLASLMSSPLPPTQLFFLSRSSAHHASSSALPTRLFALMLPLQCCWCLRRWWPAELLILGCHYAAHDPNSIMLLLMSPIALDCIPVPLKRRCDVAMCSWPYSPLHCWYLN